MATSGATEEERRVAVEPERRAPEAEAAATRREIAARLREERNEPERLACPVCGALALEPQTKQAVSHLAHGRKTNRDDPANEFDEFADCEEAPAGTWFCQSCNAVIVDTTEQPSPRR